MATVKLTELFKQNKFTSKDDRFNLRPVHVNPDFVVCLREDEQTMGLLKENSDLLPDGMDLRHQFTKVYINGGHGSFDITVIGSPDSIEEKLIKSKSTLLKG
jgi:UDP-N-acetyl-D-mannosaminuronic acid transferase (WecB/TagA/CpsF family)